MPRGNAADLTDDAKNIHLDPAFSNQAIFDTEDAHASHDEPRSQWRGCLESRPAVYRNRSREAQPNCRHDAIVDLMVEIGKAV